jgi:hypothetical protein
MFTIAQNTLHRFSLAEILLMAAINQVEASGSADYAPESPVQQSFDPCPSTPKS